MKELGFSQLDDFYTITTEQVRKYFPAGILKRYNNSFVSVLIAAHPEHGFREWRFLHAPKNIWHNKITRQRFFRELFDELGYRELSDWYKISREDIDKRGGVGLFRLKNLRLDQLLSEIYPEHEFHPWLFTPIPVGTFKDPVIRRKYMLWLKQNLKFSSWEGFYGMTVEKFKENHGWIFLSYFDYSVVEAVTSTIPEFDWRIHRFQKLPRNYFSQEENCRRYIKGLESDLGVTGLEGWYRVSRQQLYELSGATLSHSSDTLIRVILSPSLPSIPTIFNPFLHRNTLKTKSYFPPDITSFITRFS